ncbi:MAG: Rieske (2Fe-2S) protein [Thermoplasmataceae archaeon]
MMRCLALDTAVIAKENEIADETLYSARAQGINLVYFRHKGKIYVFDARCPHKSCNLARLGRLEEEFLVCTCHESEFSLANGMPVSGPARKPLRGFDVVVKENEVSIVINEGKA